MNNGEANVDFTKIEALRRHMMLTTQNMAEILGVSRVTYYGWVRGKNIRKHNTVKIRDEVKKLLNILRDHSWPSPDMIAATQKERYDRLIELLKS
jgi:DNA-binding XRE family transcriptional regulator